MKNSPIQATNKRASGDANSNPKDFIKSLNLMDYLLIIFVGTSLVYYTFKALQVGGVL